MLTEKISDNAKNNTDVACRGTNKSRTNDEDKKRQNCMENYVTEYLQMRTKCPFLINLHCKNKHCTPRRTIAENTNCILNYTVAFHWLPGVHGSSLLKPIRVEVCESVETTNSLLQFNQSGCWDTINCRWQQRPVYTISVNLSVSQSLLMSKA